MAPAPASSNFAAAAVGSDDRPMPLLLPAGTAACLLLPTVVAAVGPSSSSISFFSGLSDFAVLQRWTKRGKLPANPWMAAIVGGRCKCVPPQVCGE